MADHCRSTRSTQSPSRSRRSGSIGDWKARSSPKECRRPLRGKVEIITGVNLPMLIKFTNLREELGLEEVAKKIAETGRGEIRVASELLEMPAKKPEGEQG